MQKYNFKSVSRLSNFVKLDHALYLYCSVGDSDEDHTDDTDLEVSIVLLFETQSRLEGVCSVW